jgi:hypothetical protein
MTVFCRNIAAEQRHIAALPLQRTISHHIDTGGSGCKILQIDLEGFALSRRTGGRE